MINLGVEPMPLELARLRLDGLDGEIITLVAARLKMSQRDSVFLQKQIQDLVNLGMSPGFAEAYYRLLTEEGLRSQFETQDVGQLDEVFQLNEIDRQLLVLVVERMDISIALTKTKLNNNIAIVHPEREEAVLQVRAEKAQSLGVNTDFTKRLFRLLMDEGVRIQREVWQTTTLKKRILTGVRPTGPLHLGHYVGALKSWLEFQETYECLFLIADYQALGSHIDKPELIRDSVYQVTLDWLAVGLDPNASSFFVQSYIPEHAELTLLLSMLIPWKRHIGNPTLKSEMADMESEHNAMSLGFVNYPASQAADILLMKGDLVPVGEDQRPHIEETRRVAREFNRRYGENRTIFPIPRIYTGEVSRLVGLDGDAKMSKSKGNTIDLRDDPETVRKAVMRMFTDSTRLRATDPGHVEGNPVFIYHNIFNPDVGEVADLKARYVLGKVGDVEVKVKLAKALNQMLDPIRERRAYFEAHPTQVKDALIAGTDRARKIAEETMREVREAMRITRYAEG